MLEDGTYDALVVDAEDDPGGGMHLDLTIVAGPRKGDVVRVHATGMALDAVAVLGLPATVHVAGGRPRVDLDD